MKTLTGLTEQIRDKRGDPIIFNGRAKPTLTDLFMDIVNKSMHPDPKDVRLLDKVTDKMIEAEWNGGVLKLEDYEFELIKTSIQQVNVPWGLMIFARRAIDEAEVVDGETIE